MVFKPFRIGGALLRPGTPLIMGILNVTPDSFSDGGLAFGKRAAVDRALKMEDEGTDIVDIGGESSRPGAGPVALKEELRRVVPVIEAIRRKSSVPVSVDTRKPEVAVAAVEAGADMINDITGFRNERMAEAAAELEKPVIIMHMKGMPRTMQKNPRYKNTVREISEFLLRQARMLEGMGARKIVIDPGIGFGKTFRHNLEILRGMERFSSLGYPVMAGASRKSFIGQITGAGVSERLAGSIAAHLAAVMKGAAIIRVHDVAAHRQALDVFSRCES